MVAWADPRGPVDEELDAALRWLTDADEATEEAYQRVKILDDKGWKPPRRSNALFYEEGDNVKVSSKHRGKYLEVYGKKVVDDLIVSKLLETGELAVSHGPTTFIVSKSHVEKRKVEGV